MFPKKCFNYRIYSDGRNIILYFATCRAGGGGVPENGGSSPTSVRILKLRNSGILECGDCGILEFLAAIVESRNSGLLDMPSGGWGMGLPKNDVSAHPQFCNTDLFPTGDGAVPNYGCWTLVLFTPGNWRPVVKKWPFSG